MSSASTLPQAPTIYTTVGATADSDDDLNLFLNNEIPDK